MGNYGDLVMCHMMFIMTHDLHLLSSLLSCDTQCSVLVKDRVRL
jgi:hypothetical protein